MPLKKTVRLVSLLLFITPLTAIAWGVDGHRIVGVSALPWLDGTAHRQVVEILGNDEAATLEQACNWPDQVRETPEWEWSSPLHFVNIPRTSRHYDRQRDCRDGRCVTEGIIRYANDLQRGTLNGLQQWQALAWLCHLVGDLHQPLHAGYRDDRGANQVFIEYQGEKLNLHYFWDTALVRSRLEDDGHWERPIDKVSWARPQSWKLSSVAEWTDESHALVASSAYPGSSTIDEGFADASWLLVRRQWQKAGYRLAMVLNAVLGEGEIVLASE